jgi:hypothetical protein
MVEHLLPQVQVLGAGAGADAETVSSFLFSKKLLSLLSCYILSTFLGCFEELSLLQPLEQEYAVVS